MKPLESRRAFVRFLAASPLFASFALSGCTDDDSDDAIAAIADRMGTYGEPDQDLGELIESADKALDVFDMRVTAQRALPPAHYGYIATGVDGDVTLRANRTAFDHWQIRPHRLVGVDKLNTTTTLLGTEMETPIIISPTGSQRAFHHDGEIATARAAKSQKHLMMLSTVATVPNFLMLCTCVIHLALLQWEALREERHLIEVHGEEYQEYSRHTGRFFPRSFHAYCASS